MLGKIFIDIETVGLVSNFDMLNIGMQEMWLEKATRLLKDMTATDQQKLFDDRAAIYSEFGKVIVIGVGVVKQDGQKKILRLKSYSNKDEYILLSDFKNLLEKFDQDSLIFCGHNIKEFDIPYICRRMLINQIELPRSLNLSGKKPWEIKHIDTMEMWSFGDRKNFTSLNLLTSIFGIESSKSSMSGSEVHREFYERDNLEGIAKYCLEDVRAVAELYCKLKCIQTFDKVVYD